jgi:hypothetical protein
MQSQTPLVTAEELEALIQNWAAPVKTTVDEYFPIRFWGLFAIVFFYASWLLFFPGRIAEALSAKPAEVARIGNFLYFRGWFLAIVLWISTYAYLKNWYPSIVFSGVFLVGSINFIFDFFNLYAEALAAPSARTTATLLIRVIGLWLVFLCIKNSNRLPEAKDRLNIFLPWRNRRKN